MAYTIVNVKDETVIKSSHASNTGSSETFHTIKKSRQIKSENYVPAKSIVGEVIATTNGFKPHSLAMNVNFVIPDIYLTQFDLEIDAERQIVDDIERIYVKAVKYLQTLDHKVCAGKIIENVLYDSEDSYYSNFSVDIILCGQYDVDEIISIEDELEEYMAEPKKILSDHEIDLVFSVYTK